MVSVHADESGIVSRTLLEDTNILIEYFETFMQMLLFFKCLRLDH